MPKGRTWRWRDAKRCLRALARELGHTPGARHIEAAKARGFNAPSVNALIRLKGSLVNAQRDAGLEARPRGSPKRSHCVAGHALTPDNLYVWPRTITNAAGVARIVAVRRCKKCHKRDRKRQIAREHAAYVHRQHHENRRALPRLRVVKPDIALRHSPEEMARYWGVKTVRMAS